MTTTTETRSARDQAVDAIHSELLEQIAFLGRIYRALSGRDAEVVRLAAAFTDYATTGTFELNDVLEEIEAEFDC